MNKQNRGWVRVNIPKPIVRLIDRQKRERNEARWRVIARALIYYQRDQEEIDRYFYYANKLVNSWTYVKVALDLFNKKIVDKSYVLGHLRKFVNTTRDIQYRTHIKARHLNNMAWNLYKAFKDPKQWRKRGKLIAEINDQVREVVRALIVAEVE